MGSKYEIEYYIGAEPVTIDFASLFTVSSTVDTNLDCLAVVYSITCDDFDLLF